MATPGFYVPSAFHEPLEPGPTVCSQCFPGSTPELVVPSDVLLQCPLDHPMTQVINLTLPHCALTKSKASAY